MKLLYTLISVFLTGQLALAGDPGYSSETCVSGTKRTVLTVFDDTSGLSHSSSYSIYTLVIDGVPAIYDTRKGAELDIAPGGSVLLSNNGVKVLSMAVRDFGQEDSSILVYQDPRKGTVAENNAKQTPISIAVKCKTYWPEP